MVHDPNGPNQIKLQRAYNSDYYTPGSPGALGVEKRTNPVNNGMWTAAPTHTNAKGHTATYNTGAYDPSAGHYAVEFQESNYAMRRPNVARQVYGVGAGPHYVATKDGPGDGM